MNRPANSATTPGEDIYELDSLIREAFRQLTDEGKLELAGRLATGEPVYARTRAMSADVPTWRHVVRKCQAMIRVVGIVPALAVEYTLGYAALLLVRLWGPITLARLLAESAEWLLDWRESVCGDHVWLSIRY